MKLTVGKKHSRRTIDAVDKAGECCVANLKKAGIR